MTGTIFTVYRQGDPEHTLGVRKTLGGAARIADRELRTGGGVLLVYRDDVLEMTVRRTPVEAPAPVVSDRTLAAVEAEEHRDVVGFEAQPESVTATRDRHVEAVLGYLVPAARLHRAALAAHRTHDEVAARAFEHEERRLEHLAAYLAA